MASFNVLTEPWIPVMDKEGKIQELGIIGALEKAPDLEEICEPSPLMRYGIYRLLIAFLTDALRPEMEEDLADLMEKDQFPMERILEYVMDCEKEGPCFDLFDKERPFLQSIYSEELDASKKTSVAKLLHEFPSGNNAIHFEHRLQDEHIFSPAVCARVLCALNVFCTSGLQGPSSINGAPPWYVILTGKSLYKTLMHNLWIPGGTEISLDSPPIAWRNHLQIKPDGEIANTSYLYGLTWQSRRTCLLAEPKGGICTYTGIQSDILVKEAYFQAGWKFEGHDRWIDPFVTYIFKKDGRVSLKPHESRAVWRDLGAFLFTNTEVMESSNLKAKCPAIIEQYKTMIKRGFWNNDETLSIELFGLATNKASYEGWQHERFKIDWSIVGSEQKSAWLEEALEKTEETNKILRRALHRIPPQHGKKKINQKWFLDELIDQAELQFFTAIRRRFFEELIPRVAKTNTEYGWREPLNEFWFGLLTLEARSIFNQIIDSIGTGARNLERRVAAEKSLFWSLNELMKGGRVANDTGRIG